MARRLTDSMYQMLRDCVERGDPFWSRHGRSSCGGSGQTLRALVKRGFIARDVYFLPNDGAGWITEAGREALHNRKD